jgi:hypothetical protein
MSAALGRLATAMPAAAVVVLAAACGGGQAASPTATTAATVIAEAAPTYSVLVQGTVTDSHNRPLAGAEVECMGNVTCGSPNAQVIEQDGPDSGVQTNAAGAYALLVRSSGSGGHFLMNALKKGYEYRVQEAAFPDATCTADRAGCTVTLNFTLGESE